MANTTFVNGTVIEAAWLNDVNDYVYENVINVKTRGAVGNGTTDDRAAIQSAIDEASAAGGGTILFPTGTYLINGAASDDTYLNGLVIPFSSFTVDNRIKLLAAGKVVLVAGTDDMVVVRMCQPGSELEGMQINGKASAALGDTFTNVIGVGLIAEDRTQTTTLVSQSFCKIFRCHIQRCTEGIMLEPGPTVLGSQSGCFYPVIEECDLNFNIRSVWAKVSPHDATNRPTRGNIAFNRIERGNCGVDLSYATEFTMVGNNFQFFNNTYTGPIATSSAIHIGTLSENNYLYGGNAEACDYDINNEATLPNALMIHGFALTGTNNNAGTLPVVQPHLLQLTNRTGSNEALKLTAKNNSFANIVFDYTASDVKDVSVYTNNIRRMTWFNGITTHVGSTANITMDATGTELKSSVDDVSFLGSPSLRWGRAYVTTVFFGDGTRTISSGAGSPEGALSAPVGSLYTNTSGGASTTLYVKTSGTGPTGWTAK